MKKSLIGMLFTTLFVTEAFSAIEKKAKSVNLCIHCKAVSDPINDTVNPKMIPGAKVMFNISVDNNTAKSITGATVTEDFNIEKYEYLFGKLPVTYNKKKTKMYIKVGTLKPFSHKNIKYYAMLK